MKGVSVVVCTEEKIKIEMKIEVTRGDVVWVNFPQGNGSVQSGVRPAIVVSNDKNNRYSPNITVVPVTSKSKKYIPTHVYVGTQGGLSKSSTVLCEEVMPVDKKRITGYIGHLFGNSMNQIETAIKIQMALS